MNGLWLNIFYEDDIFFAKWNRIYLFACFAMNDTEQISWQTDGEVGLVEWHDFTSDKPFLFESGQSLPGISLRYETYGRLNRDRSNAILICHALSGDHHCAGVHSMNDRKMGWWNNIIGPGKPVDTNQFFVISSNCIGGCQGSIGPSSIRPDTGSPWYLDFPDVTIADMVHAQHRLITEALGLERLFAVIGGSMGGMQVLQWAIDFPGFVNRYIPMATTARQSAQAIAFNEVGRCAIMQDPGWNNGRYLSGKGPNVGLAIARMMAHITYLSDQGLEAKFGRTRQNGSSAGKRFDAEFEVESYLRHQGESFINRFDANTYLYFTKALDRFDLFGSEQSLDSSFKNVQGKFLTVGFTSDWLFPPSQNREIVHSLLRCGKHATYAEINMTLGHDSFLVHAPELYRLVNQFLLS
jgi:homoserine O-acetyltransferase